MSKHHHELLREGITTGLLGAFSVAIWFLAIDSAQGHPFSTPSVLGQVLLFGNSTPSVTPIATGPLVAYTLLHVGVFVLFGIGVTHLVHLAMYSALARFALFIVAVVFELFFFMLTIMLFAGTSYLFPAWSVLGANTLALIAMGTYLRRTHPGVGRSMARESLGA